jgi:hypothetical protein
VVYESMYGNTRAVAEAIGQGLGPSGGVDVVAADRLDPAVAERADLLVVGGPTHVHGMSRARTRAAALEAASRPGTTLATDPDAGGDGLREWFGDLGTLQAKAAAFDTRVEGPPVLTGRAAKGIARMLTRHGLDLVAEPESFLVDRDNHLLPGETDRARDWGARLAAAVTAPAATN